MFYSWHTAMADLKLRGGGSMEEVTKINPKLPGKSNTIKQKKEKLFPGVGARAFLKIGRLDDTLAASPGLEDSPQKVHNLPLGASLSLIY